MLQFLVSITCFVHGTNSRVHSPAALLGICIFRVAFSYLFTRTAFGMANNAFEIISLCFYSLAITHKFEKDASSSDGLAHDLAH